MSTSTTGARPPLDTVARVATPEHIELELRLAGPWSRALAYGIDLMLRGFALAMLMFVFAVGLSDFGDQDPSMGALLIVFFLVEWGYYIVFETLWNGQSPGKRALSLRVVKQTGVPIGFVDSLLRNLVRAADWLPIGGCVGAIVSGLDPKFRRLGDLVAGTVVVGEERTALAALARRSFTPIKPRGDDEPLPTQITLDPELRHAVSAFVARADRLGLGRRAELAALLAPAVAAQLGVSTCDPDRLLHRVHRQLTATPAGHP